MTVFLDFLFFCTLFLESARSHLSQHMNCVCCYSLSSRTGGSCPCLLRTHLALTGNCVNATAAEKERETKTPPLSRVLERQKVKIGQNREKCHIHPCFAFSLLKLCLVQNTQKYLQRPRFVDFNKKTTTLQMNVYTTTGATNMVHGFLDLCYSDTTVFLEVPCKYNDA